MVTVRRGSPGASGWLPPTRRGSTAPVVIVAAANDSITFSDAAVVAQEFEAIAADTIVFSDAALGGLAMLAAANDSVAFTDEAIGETIEFYGFGEDSIALSDSAESVVQIVATATDTRTFSDSAIGLTNRVAAASDSLSLSDSAMASGAGSEPYPWDETFDLAQLPFQATDPVQVVEAPQGTLVDVTATNESELAAALYTRFRRITFTGRIEGPVFNDGNIQDVHLILADGSLLKDPFFGSFDGSRLVERFLITTEAGTEGPGTPGVSGQLHQAQFFGPGSDVMFGGMIHSGPAGNAGAVVFHGSWDRVGGVWGLSRTGGYFYLGTPSDFTLTHYSMRTGMDVATPAESWGVRNSHEALGNIVGYACDIRSNPARSNNSHHRWRVHPDPGLLNVWLGYSLLLDFVESRIFWCNAAAGSGSGDADAVFLVNCLILATTTAPADPPPSIEISDTLVARVNFNEFESDTFLSPANITISGVPDANTGDNDFVNTVPTEPAWQGAGNPDAIDWTPTV